MNDAKLSNSRTSLSNSFLNLCHFFKLSNYTQNEIALLANRIIRKGTNKLYNKEVFKIVLKCFNISKEYKYSENGGNTFREILN